MKDPERHRWEDRRYRLTADGRLLKIRRRQTLMIESDTTPTDPATRLLERFVAGVLRALLAYAIVGLPLAIAGWFHAFLVWPGVLGVFIALTLVWRLRDSGDSTELVDLTEQYEPTKTEQSTGSSWPTLLAVAFAIVVTVVNIGYSSEHLLGDRDPGVYLTTARWLAHEGTLVIDARTGAFVGQDDLTYAEQAFDEDPDDAPGRLYPQFLHLLPVVLAGAMWLGGIGLALKLPAVLGGLSILIIYCFARRLITQPWLALAAAVAIGLSLVQIHIARDAYTEILVQPLLFGGLWMLWSARERLDAVRSLFAAMLIGATAMARIDGFLFLVPLSAYGLIETLRLRGQDIALQPMHHRYLVALAPGALLTASVALGDLALRSPVYIEDLRMQLISAAAMLAVIWTVGPLVVLLARTSQTKRLRSSFHSQRRRFGAIAAFILVGLALGAYFIRPSFTVHGSSTRIVGILQEQEHTTIDATRTYDEQTLRWIGWYLGLPVLLAGIAGWAMAARRAVMGRAARQLPFMLFFTTITVTYLWEHGATPDHPWVMRRFVPLTLPGMVLLAAWLADRYLHAPSDAWAKRWIPIGGRHARTVIVGLFAATMIGWPLATVAPVVEERTQAGMREGIHSTCRAIGHDAAVVILPGKPLDRVFAQTLRSYCRVPVAIASPRLAPTEFATLAERWDEQGRKLHFIGAHRGAVDAIPDSGLVAEIEVTGDHALKQTIEHRPNRYADEQLTILVATLTTNASSPFPPPTPLPLTEP